MDNEDDCQHPSIPGSAPAGATMIKGDFATCPGAEIVCGRVVPNSNPVANRCALARVSGTGGFGAFAREAIIKERTLLFLFATSPIGIVASRRSTDARALNANSDDLARL